MPRGGILLVDLGVHTTELKYGHSRWVNRGRRRMLEGESNRDLVGIDDESTVAIEKEVGGSRFQASRWVLVENGE